MRTTSAAKLAVAVRGLREKSPELELAGSEPLAIIGIGCRFSGGVTEPDGLWKLLLERRNVAGEIPADRFTREDMRGPSSAAAFEYCRGAFLQDIDRFDAQYFGAFYRIRADVGATLLSVDLPPADAPRARPGQRVHLHWDADAVHALQEAP